MKTRTWLALGLAAAVAAPAFAGGDHKKCTQDKAACIREAGAAAQASRQGNLTHASDATYRQNALARCQAP